MGTYSRGKSITQVSNNEWYLVFMEDLCCIVLYRVYRVRGKILGIWEWMSGWMGGRINSCTIDIQSRN